jgi:hypothetical protein
MSTYKDILEKLSAGEVVYLINRFYSTAIKVVPGTTHYKAKQTGGKEYDIERSTDLVCDTLEIHEEITEREYNQY